MTLYYNDEQVVFFVDRKGTISRVQHGDSNANGIHIHALRDESGNLVSLEVDRR